jgi:hypothetical protein
MRGFNAMLISLHEHFKIRITDWLLSAILFSWGLALFAVDPSVWALPTLNGLSSIAPQIVWASAATVIGFARIIALFINGAMRRSPHLRLIGAGLTIFLWVQLSLGVLCSDMVGPGIAIFPWLAFADMFNVYRAATDARASDHRASEQRRVAAARAPAT